jgi:hypothetical protein
MLLCILIFIYGFVRSLMLCGDYTLFPSLSLARMPVPKFPSDAVVTWFFAVLLTLWLSCLCVHSLPLRSIVCSKYDPNMFKKQGQRHEQPYQANLETSMHAEILVLRPSTEPLLVVPFPSASSKLLVFNILRHRRKYNFLA